MSTTRPYYEPANEGTPTSASNSNISLLQSGYTLDYAAYTASVLGKRPGDLKEDLTEAPHGKRNPAKFDHPQP
jgi:hypothetical protein